MSCYIGRLNGHIVLLRLFPKPVAKRLDPEEVPTPADELGEGQWLPAIVLRGLSVGVEVVEPKSIADWIKDG